MNLAFQLLIRIMIFLMLFGFLWQTQKESASRNIFKKREYKKENIYKENEKVE